MTMPPVTEMKHLQEGLVAGPFGIEAELTTFPSGSAMLDVRRDGRAFVMAYTPEHGYGVDELHKDDGFTSGYRFVFKDFEAAACQLRTMATSVVPALSLVVLQSANIEAAKAFYGLLGVSFVEEQHGKGPRHYAATLGPLVLEIYPCRADKPSAPIRIGFQVPALDQTVEALRGRGMRILQEPTESPWGRRAVVEDPDGNSVELASLIL
jgi:lactoylglutathione lyase